MRNNTGEGWDWDRVAVHVPSRGRKQCKEKWHNDFMPGEWPSLSFLLCVATTQSHFESDEPVMHG